MENIIIKKICLRCNTEKDLDEFSTLKKGKLGKHPNCNDCRRNYQNDRYAQGLVKKVKYTYAKTLKQYNLSLDDYNQMLEKQDFKCMICPSTERLVVDHCHSTGKVRGLLCNSCNIGLGKFRDNKEYLKKAIEYLNL